MCRNNGFVHDRILKVFPHITWWISNKYGTVYFDLRFLAYKNPILSIQDGVPCCYRKNGIVAPRSGEISISCVPQAFPVAGSVIFI